MKRSAAFAIPGDIETLTGGYIYERRLLEALRAEGRAVAQLHLAASFPDPNADEMADAIVQLQSLGPQTPVIVDGLVFGAIDTEGLARVRAPVVAMIHHPLALESGLEADRRDHFFRTERDNLALASHVVVPSRHTREILLTRFGLRADRITVAPPGTDRPAPRPGPPASPPLILSVGILHPRKGHDVLLRALAMLGSEDWQAVIVGKEHEPGEMARLRTLRDELGLAGKVRLAGMIPRDELDALYRSATIFALATRYEGYGIVFDEALSYGLPIVSCRTGAVPDTVPPDAGTLVAAEDSAAMAGALSHLMTDDAARARMAAAAARAGKALPGWSETGAIMSRVLDSLAGT
ncbi:glycosyltransferase [Sulfitobacter sp. LCG007]